MEDFGLPFLEVLWHDFRTCAEAKLGTRYFPVKSEDVVFFGYDVIPVKKQGADCLIQSACLHVISPHPGNIYSLQRAQDTEIAVVKIVDQLVDVMTSVTQDLAFAGRWKTHNNEEERGDC